MDRLPYELLYPILSELSQEDLVNLPFSVTSRGLSEKEISDRFSTVDVWLDEKSLNTLLRVAQHPLFSPSIQRLRFHSDELASVGPLRFRHYDWGQNCEDGPCNLCYKADDHLVKYNGDEDASLQGCKDFVQKPDCATKRYLRYRTLYDAQESMKKQKKDYILLVKALRRFRSLPAIIIDFHYGFSSRARWPILLGNAWVQQCESLRPRVAGIRVFEMLMRALARCNLWPSEFGIDNTATPRLPARPDIQYLPEIQRLLMEEDDNYFTKRRPGFQPLPRIFSNLRKFTLCSLGDALKNETPLASRHSWEGWVWMQPWGQFQTNQDGYKIDITLGFILNQCEMLEDLELHFADQTGV